jgi:hypothetical protein
MPRVLMLLLVVLTGCTTPKADKVIHLLEPQNFYSFLRDFGRDKDPNHVFNWENGMLHITGQDFGYYATKQTNFANYKLVAEFKWGEKTWAPRVDNARDSGVLVHFVGRDQVWPKSIECQMIEGGTGDILVVNGAFLTVDGVRKGPGIARFDRPGRNPWDDKKGFRGPHEIENPHGQWNKLEVLCSNDVVSVSVNGHHTLTGTNATPTMGKIVLQSEGAEVFFRRLDLYPLAK